MQFENKRKIMFRTKVKLIVFEGISLVSDKIVDVFWVNQNNSHVKRHDDNGQ